MVRNLPANAGAAKDTGLPSQGWEYPLEKGMATHSSILAWRIPWAEEPDGTVHGVTKNGTALSEHTHTHQCTGVRYERLQGCNERLQMKDMHRV